MKITAFIGSTRKNGDSVQTIKLVEERMNAIQPAEFTYVFLEDLQLGFCRGCGLCIKKDESLCPHRGIMAGVENRIAESDGIILASPVYEHHVTALMKNFMDHLAYLYHRPRFLDKFAIVIAPTGGSGLKETLGYLNFTVVGWGLQLLGSLGIISPLMRSSEKYKQSAERRIDGLAQAMRERVHSGKRPSPHLYDMIFFRSMRLKARGIEVDRSYWAERNWLKQDYFTAGPINPISNFLAAVIEAMYKGILRSTKDAYGKRA